MRKLNESSVSRHAFPMLIIIRSETDLPSPCYAEGRENLFDSPIFPVLQPFKMIHDPSREIWNISSSKFTSTLDISRLLERQHRIVNIRCTNKLLSFYDRNFSPNSNYFAVSGAIWKSVLLLSRRVATSAPTVSSLTRQFQAIWRARNVVASLFTFCVPA